MESTLKARIDAAINTVSDKRNAAVQKLIENNTFTQKNAEKFGVLKYNKQIKDLTKFVNNSTSESDLKELKESLEKAEKKVSDLKDKIAQATGEGVSESLEKLLAEVESENTQPEI